MADRCAHGTAGPLETLRSSRTCVMEHEWRMRADGTRVARAECVLYALRFVRTVRVSYQKCFFVVNCFCAW